MKCYDEIIAPKPLKNNSICLNSQFNSELQTSLLTNNSSIQFCQNLDSFVSTNFSNIQKDDLTFTSFKSGIEEDNFYEEISQIISNDSPISLDRSNQKSYPNIERPKCPFNNKNIDNNEEEEDDAEEDLEAELAKIQL